MSRTPPFSSTTPFLPGATIGFLGGGQLSRMMALEARRMGYGIAVLDPDPKGPAGQLADFCVEGEFDDLEGAKALAVRSDVVTLDTEHVPAEILQELEAICPVRPGAAVFRIVQDRAEQRRFLDGIGVPHTAHAEVGGLDDLNAAIASLGTPCVLKTRRSGYDGKGQVKITKVEEAAAAWGSIDQLPAVLEAFVDFEKEVSVLLARDVEGNCRFYPVAENVHRDHILYSTQVPARIAPELVAEAEQIGESIASALDHVGMMAVELFVTRDGRLLVNEIAPRTHNSGHYTFGPCVTSQFAQHVRAICGLPLGDTSLLQPVVMLNLLGDLWADGDPDWSPILSLPMVHLHLYGKREARPGRKMGHVLVLGADEQQLAETLSAVERALSEVPA